MNAGQTETLKSVLEKLKKASTFCGEIGGDHMETVDEDLQFAIAKLEELLKN